MKLSSEQILSCARGVAYMTEQDGLVRLHRFTAAQEELYKQNNQEHYDRSFATAGIVLEFDTDSVSLSLSVRCRKGSSRHWFVHSVFVNGQRLGELRGKFTPPEYVEAEGVWQLGQGTKRVKIVFPWSAGSEIRSLTLSAGASFLPVKKEKRVLIFGDSITQGYDAQLPECAYASLLADYLDGDCVNKAIGGAVFLPELAQLTDDFVPELITVAYGTNDWSGVGNDKLVTRATNFYTALRNNYPKATIYMLTPVWRGDWERERPCVHFRQIPEIFTEIAEKIGNAHVIDCFDFIPQDPACYSPDVLHPNDRGFDFYMDGLRRTLDSLR